jgi:hypothetical protein
VDKDVRIGNTPEAEEASRTDYGVSKDLPPALHGVRLYS